MNKKVLIVVAIIMMLISICVNIYKYNYKYSQWKNKIIEVEILSKKNDEEYIVRYNKDKFLLSLKSENSEYSYGDKLKILSSNYKIEKYNNPYEFDYKLYLNSNFIVSKIYCNKVLEKCEGKRNILKIIYDIKKQILEKINIKNANILKSIIFGEDSYLDDEIKEKYYNVGIGHYLCVSGTHVIFLFMIYDKITKSQNNTIIKTIILIYFYFISSFSMSLLRVIIMFLLSKIDKNIAFYKKCIITLYIVLYINPYNIFNLSVIFSFLSLIGIYKFFSFFSSFIKVKILKNNSKILTYVINNIALTLSSQILILPIQIYNFNTINILSIISNLVLALTLNLILSFGFSLFFLIFVPGISSLLLIICNYLIEILNYQVDILNKFSVINIKLPKIDIVIIIMYYIYIFISMYKDKIAISFWNIRKRIKKCIKYLKICIITYFFIWYIYIVFLDKYIIFFNVGQGNMALIHSMDKNIIIDIGSTMESTAGKVMLNFLNAKNIKNIDVILITHMHKDHINGIETLINSGISINRIGYSIPFEKNSEYEALINLIRKNKISKMILNKDDRIKIGNISIDVLLPDSNNYIEDEDMLNANSTIYYITANNVSCLFMGDATKNTERKLLKEDKIKNIDILQVGHHGSKTSSSEEFISKINSCNAIISSKESVYGHPNEEVLEILNKYKFKIFITEKVGAIKF